MPVDMPVELVHDKLDEIVRTLEQSRAVPLSSSAIVDRADLLALLDELRAVLPPALAQAQAVLADREEVVEQGRREAAELLVQAHDERNRLVEATEVHAAAVAEAARLVEEAREQAWAMQVEVDDYVDGKLANFEVVLHKTLSAVERGRAKLAGRSELDELAGPDDPPLPPDRRPPA